MGHALGPRPWVPRLSERLVQDVAGAAASLDASQLLAELDRLVGRNHQIHDVEALNLNPATNVMNPRAEALLSAHLGSRASLGYPGAKYETGLEAIERLEVIAAELVAEVFKCRFAEVRVPSGAIANLYAFMATCRPGDTIIAPPPEIGGHVTHHEAGAAGLYGLRVMPAPVDPGGYTLDVPALRELAHRVKPKLITVGGSLNLFPHPVARVREIADRVGARVLFDAAHLCGVIAGRAWPSPLAQGADLVTMSTYKSLGGPSGGLVITDDAALAERVDRIAHPGLTANFDAGKIAALVVTMVDWKVAGADYAKAMVACATRLASELTELGVPVFHVARADQPAATESHQFAVRAHRYGGGQRASRRLRGANLLTCGIGLPVDAVPDDLNGIRIGTPEIVRLGFTEADMPRLAELIARGLHPASGPEQVGAEVTEWRRQFRGVRFTAG